MNPVRFENDFLIQVEKFNGKLLNRKEDISIIIEACNQNNKPKDFERLSFTGKYVNGLFKVLKTSDKNQEVKSVDHIKKDLSENIEKLISQLKEITFQMNEKNKKKIEQNYLELLQNSLQNLQQLAEDLDNIKKYLNHLKRKVSN